MKNLRELWFMFVLTSVCTVVLVLAEEVYQKRLAADPVLVRRVLQLATGNPGPDVDIRTRFESLFQTRRSPAFKGLVYQGRQNPGLLVREEEGAGLWGTIGLLVAFDAEKKLLSGIDVLFHSETPGLGARIEEPKFLDQFKGLAASRGVKAAKIKFREGEFDAVSGATLSSKAVEEIVNRAVHNMRLVAADGVGEVGQKP